MNPPLLDHSSIQGIKEAVESGNNKKLNSLLGCRLNVESCSTGSGLHRSTDLGRCLLDLLSSYLSDSPSPKKVLSLDLSFQALLMAHPHYETPWMAAYELVSHCTSLESTTMGTCVSAIECFLRQLKNASVEQSSFEPGSNIWLVRIVRNIMETLLCENFYDAFSTKEMGDSIYSILSDLLRTIIAATRELDAKSFQTIIEAIFHCKPHPSRMLALLEITYGSIAFIRSIEMDKVRNTLLDNLRYNQALIPLCDLPAIVSISLKLGSMASQVSDESTRQSLLAWYRVPTPALHATSADPKLYSLLEDQLSSALALFKSSNLDDWCETVMLDSSESDLPQWNLLNILLLTFNSIHHSCKQMVSSALKRAMGKSSPPSGRTLNGCCQSILKLFFRPDEKLIYNDFGLSGAEDIDGDLTKIVEAVDNVAYRGNGLFVDEDGDELEGLSAMGKILLKMIFLGDTSMSNSEYPSNERVSRVLDATSYMLRTLTDSTLIRVILHSVICTVTVYVEVPSSRVWLANSIGSDFVRMGKSSQDFSQWDTAHFAAVSLLVRSATLLCENDSKDMKMLDPICEVLTIPLPGEIFRRLSLALSSLPSARESILRSCRKRLDVLYAQSWSDTENKSLFNQESIRSGLLGLLEILRKTNWGNCEIEAWKYFSDSFVLDMPPLPTQDRLWLYEQIQDLIYCDEISMTASNHFMRAVIMRASVLLSSQGFKLEGVFISWEEDARRSRLQAEDTVALHRLLMSFLLHLSQDDGADMRSALLSKGQEALLRSVLAFRESDTSSALRPVTNFLRFACEDSKDKDKFALYCGMAFCLLSHLLNHLMWITIRRKDKDFEQSNIQLIDVSIDTLSRIQSWEALELELQYSGNLSERDVPSWLHHSFIKSSVPERSEGAVDSTTRVPVRSSLFDLMVEVLFTPTEPTGISQKQFEHLSRKIILAVGHLLRSRGNFVAENDGKSSLGPQTTKKSVVGFFTAASVVIHDIVSHDFGIDEAEEYVEAIMQYCDSFRNSTESSQIPESLPLLESIWALYQVIGAEEAAIGFIAYLEAHFSDSHSSVEKDQSICSLRSIRSGEDVDVSIQNIRLKVLRALQSCISLTSSARTYQQEDDDHSLSITPMSESMSQISLVVSVLEALSKDLRIGLEGKSGGITSDLYLAYIECIEDCAILLYDVIISTEIHDCSRVLIIIMDVAESLKDILISFPLENAALFRATFVMAAAVLPSMCRGMTRRSCANPKITSSHFSRVVSIDQVLVSGTVADCLRILARWSTLRDPNSVPWEGIAGFGHLESEDEVTSTEDDSVEVSVKSATDGESNAAHAATEVPSIVRIPVQTSQERVSVVGTRRIRLSSKEMWSWALTCTLLVLEENWRDSYRVMLQARMNDLQTLDSPGLPQCSTYMKGRKKELLSCIIHIGRFFDCSSSEKHVDSRGHRVILDVLAMNVPSAPRLRLCGTLGTIAKSLVHSLDLLCDYFEKESGGKSEEQARLALLEPLCCVSSWLCLDTQEIDFTIGVFRWLSILKRKRPPGESSDKRHDALDLIGRLSHVVTSIRNLVGGLQRLKRSVYEAGEERSEICQTLGDLVEGGKDGMLRLIEAKLCLIREAMPKDELNLLPDFPASDDSRKKVRPAREARGRPKRRRLLRSRNRVVDIFMRMDEGIGGREGGGGDAYADLEDFLREG